MKLNILRLLYKISGKIDNGLQFKYEKKVQENFIRKFPEAKNDLERSYNQYRCQMMLKGCFISIVINIASFFLIPFILICCNKKVYRSTNVDVVCFFSEKTKCLIPVKLYKEFDVHRYIDSSLCSLSHKDYSYIFKIIFKYPLSFHFLLKAILKIAMYSYVIQSFHPRAIIVCSEYSFTSSLLTDYCNNSNVLHINIMHGEKIYYIRDSFFHFNRCYVWDNYYKDLFVKLRAEKNQFIVCQPPALHFTQAYCKNKIYKFTYYLGGESGEELNKIKNILSGLKEKNYNVSLRMHPRYSDVNKVNLIFKDFEIQDNNKTSLAESVMQTQYSISLYSTVLIQAECNNCKIVIDNMTNEKKYMRLIDLEYRMVLKNHMTLSEVLKNELN